MKKNILLVFFFFFVVTSSPYAQNCQLTSYQNVYWNKGVPVSTTKNKFFTSSGQMFIVGYTRSALNQSMDAWLMKTTARGTPLWSKAIGTPVAETIYGG